VTIPDSVTSIGAYAFSLCSGLTSVIFRGDAPTVGDHGFNAVNPGCVAYVPRKAKGFAPDSQGKWNGVTLVRYTDDEDAAMYDVIAGAKVSIDVGLVGYKESGLPAGLKYDAKTGKVTGAAKTKGEYVATFAKAGEADVSATFVVRDENVSVACEALAGGSFTVGVAGSRLGGGSAGRLALPFGGAARRDASPYRMVITAIWTFSHLSLNRVFGKICPILRLS